MKHVCGLAWLLFVLGAGPAFAHAPVPGLKGFYVGALHPFSTPSQALMMIGLGLLIGGFAVKKIGWLLTAFLASAVLGLFFGSAAQDLDAPMLALAFSACSVAALVSGRFAPVAVVLVALGGLMIGSASIPDGGPVRDRVFTMTGSMVGANVGLLYIVGFTNFVRERYTWPWVGVAFRVIAAWLGAVALLMFALGTVEVETTSEAWQDPRTKLVST